MIYKVLPFLGGSAERGLERFFAKAGIQHGTIAFVGNFQILGVKPDLCVDLYEGPVKEDARTFVPPEKYDNVISISTIEHAGTGDMFDPQGPKQAIRNIINWIKPGAFLYVTVPFGKPTPGLERKAGEFWAQYYPPQGLTTFMPFTSKYIKDLKESYSDRFKFLFLKRVNIRENRWAWCDEEDAQDCEMLDDGSSAIMIFTNKDFRFLSLISYFPELTVIWLKEYLLNPAMKFLLTWRRRIIRVWTELQAKLLTQWYSLLRNL